MAAFLNCVSKSLLSEESPKFSPQVVNMIIIPTASKQDAASNGATGPNPKVSTSRFPNNPDKMATRPFPRNIALEKVTESHCCSNPFCNIHSRFNVSSALVSVFRA